MLIVENSSPSWLACGLSRQNSTTAGQLMLPLLIRRAPPPCQYLATSAHEMLRHSFGGELAAPPSKPSPSELSHGRGPQSAQSEPLRQWSNSAPGPPSSQSPSSKYPQSDRQLVAQREAPGASGGALAMGGVRGVGGAGAGGARHSASVTRPHASCRGEPVYPICREEARQPVNQ